MKTLTLLPDKPNWSLIRDEEGAATVWSAALAAVVCLLLVGIITISGVLHTRQQAAHLADGAAVAAARTIPHHSAETCQRAADWVQTQAPHNRLVSCAVREHPQTHMPAVWVEVEVEYARWTIRGRACAGPVPPR